MANARIHASLIFDLDGTLIDSRADIADAVNEFRAERNLPPLPLETVVSYIGDGATKLLERSLTDAPEIDPHTEIEAFRIIYRRHTTIRTILYPGVAEGVARLHARGFKLAMLSNKPQNCCMEIMTHYGIAPYFTHIIGGSGNFPLKPDPTAILHILGENQSEANTTWMIGDNHTDIQAGRNAGIRTCLVTYGFGTPNGLVPDLIVDHFAELVAAFCD